MKNKIGAAFNSLTSFLKMKAAGEQTAATLEEKISRIAICKDCESYASKTLGGLCVECFCVMDIKAGLKAETCPLKRW